MSVLIGIPVSVVAYGFVQLVSHLQTWLFHSLPSTLGYHHEPVWWPFPVVVVASVVVGLTLRYIPGNGGHSPADGFSPGLPEIPHLPGIVLASTATLAGGVVLGPEAPLIAIGGGLGLIAARVLLRRPGPMETPLLGAAGSFAALGTIFGSPVVAAIFLMEGIGLGGPMLTLLLLPGLLCAGIGTLIFVGLGRWTGLGSSSLAVPSLPSFGHPHVSQIGWCIVVGVIAALVGWTIRWGAMWLRSYSRRNVVLLTPVAGLAVAGLAVAFTHATGRPSSDVLFSGQNLIGPLILKSNTWALSALALLLLFKGLAYGVSLSSFRGGPIFPALLIGTAGGILAGHLPGFGAVPGVAAGLGAMMAAMLRLPFAAVLLPVILLFHDQLDAAPLIIVAVVTAYVVVERLPAPTERLGLSPAPAGLPASAPASGAPNGTGGRHSARPWRPNRHRRASRLRRPPGLGPLVRPPLRATRHRRGRLVPGPPPQNPLLRRPLRRPRPRRRPGPARSPGGAPPPTMPDHRQPPEGPTREEGARTGSGSGHGGPSSVGTRTRRRPPSEPPPSGEKGTRGAPERGPPESLLPSTWSRCMSFHVRSPL